jgi:hypothetical protein
MAFTMTTPKGTSAGDMPLPAAACDRCYQPVFGPNGWVLFGEEYVADRREHNERPTGLLTLADEALTVYVACSDDCRDVLADIGGSASFLTGFEYKVRGVLLLSTYLYSLIAGSGWDKPGSYRVYSYEAPGEA